MRQKVGRGKGWSMNAHTDKVGFEELLSRLTDSGLDESEFERLGSFIESDSALCRRYLEYCQIHGLLRAEHGILASWGVTEPDIDKALLTKRSRRPWWRQPAVAIWFSVAALVAIMALPIWHFARENSTSTAAVAPPYRGLPVARLTKQVRAYFAYGPN